MVRAGVRVSPLIFIIAKRDTVSENLARFRSNRERCGDLFVSKDQHSVTEHFSTGLDVLGDRIAIDIGLV